MDSNAPLSLVGLILHADPVVQAVVAGLVLCSVLCWAIIIEKILRLRVIDEEANQLAAFAAKKLDTLEANSLAAHVATAGQAEAVEGKAEGDAGAVLRGRVEDQMRAVLIHDLRQSEKGLSFLATTGSAAPFIGLFGTVWGIMHAFTSIASAKDTSLSVVAPGIAEALFATAIGLVAAIPAVIAFNQISTSLSRHAQNMNGSIGKISKTLSRPEGVE